TDGKYVYTISDKTVIIVRAWPTEKAGVIAKIELNGSPIGIFINGDKLVIFERSGTYYGYYEEMWYSPYEYRTFIKVYDIKNRANPILVRNLSAEGTYISSRMIGDYVYVVIQQYVSWKENEIMLPKIHSYDNVNETIPATAIYYCNVSDHSYTFTTVLSINVRNDKEKHTYTTLLLGDASHMYVSINNIYITVTKWDYKGQYTSKTLLYRIHIKGAELELVASGEVPGTVLNQFSMDEYNGYFRIATTIGHVWDKKQLSKNNIYVLDLNLNIVSALTDLAPGERIYSARFMGERCYLVTFKKVDPFFVIDLKNPNCPKVLGELKITGYSDYLHPYYKNYVIGIGKETVDVGDFAWYQGVKISVFDVKVVSDPKELAKYVIGDRGTDSPVLHDHKAILVDSSKQILVIPILLAEINKSQYPNPTPSTYGEYVWQGAYVFDLSLEGGLILKG
ncbi:MAG: beta-propeller domain-containing protein, partial [Candidatus Thermoplasmatota archaeon]